MGPSPPPPAFTPPPPPPPPSSSLPRLLSSADDWFLQASDPDTQLLTQALTRELSSGSRDSASSSLFPSASPSASASASAPCSSSSFYEAFRRCLEGRSLQSQSFDALRALQQQHQQQQQRQQQQHQHQQPQNHHQQQQKAMAMSSMNLRGDGFLYLDQNSLQKGSPLSGNASPPSTETPASPFSTSTLSANSAMSTITASYSKQNNPQHHDSQDGHFVRTMAPSLKPPEVSPVPSDSSLSSRAASTALSSQASVGASGNKVNKRRSRGSSKAPITVLSADASNFRAMVQQLTGIPTSSTMHSYQSGMPIFKPQPIRHSFPSTLNLPTLDTSACFLGPRNMKEGFSFARGPHQLSSSSAANSKPFPDVDPFQGQSVENNMLQSLMPSHFNDQANAISQSLPSSSPSVPKLWDSLDSYKTRASFSSLHDQGEQISVRQNAIPTPATFESLLMEDHLVPKSSFNTVDSWMSFDGAHANHASNMEVARMA